MKLGRVVFDLGYVVDLENPEMVAAARDAIYEDMMNAYKYDNVADHMEIIDAPEAKESDIPDFLVEDFQDGIT
jgi:hypothetical protein